MNPPLLRPLAFAALFLAFAQWVFSRLDDKIPDRLI